MDMKVNSKLVRSEREKRAWSQEHLAHVTGLAIRTVHRIENTGSASHESVKALASVFEIEIDTLLLREEFPVIPKHLHWLRRVGIALVSPVHLIVKGDLLIRNFYRVSIIITCLVLAIICYLLGLNQGLGIFLVIGAMFELACYFTLVKVN